MGRSGQASFDRQPGRLSGAVANPVTVFRGLNLFGLRTRKVLRYQESVPLTGSGLNLSNSFVFSANGAFDPNISGTGHQPMGFDQMMVFYNHYTVVRARITAAFENTTANPCRVGLTRSANTTVITNYNNLIENGSIVVASLTPVGVFGSTAVLRANHSPGAFQGLDDVLDDPDMRGDAASNPTEQSYFHLYVWDPFAAAAPVVLIDVTIDYTIVFHEPRKATSS